MSHNGPFELTTGGPSRNNQQLSVPTLPTSLLPSVDLSPPQRRAVGPDRSFTKAALGKPRPAPYSRSRGPPATSHVGPVWPAWLAPQPATKGSASEGVSPHHCNTPNTFGSSSRAAGVAPMAADHADELLPFFRSTNQTDVLIEAAMISPIEGSATPDGPTYPLKHSDLLNPHGQFSLKTPSPRKQKQPSSFITPDNHNTPSPPRTPCPRKDIEPPLTVLKLRAEMGYGLNYLTGMDLSSWQYDKDRPPTVVLPTNLNTPPGARRVDYEPTNLKDDSGDDAEEEAEMLASVNKPRRA